MEKDVSSIFNGMFAIGIWDEQESAGIGKGPVRKETPLL